MLGTITHYVKGYYLKLYQINRQKNAASQIRVVTIDMQTAFSTTNRSLSEAVTLGHSLPNSIIVLTTDASDVSIGAYLEQHTERSWKPISIFGKKLNISEQK